MRVFVTGATGWVGAALVSDLLAGGHRVIGLSRSAEKAEALADRGVEILHGTLGDLDILRDGVERADAVVHTAFNHDFSRFVENAAEDRRAIEAMGAALKGSDRPLIVTSGFASLGMSGPATEAADPPAVSDRYPRASEAAAEALAEQGVRTAAMRLAPSVHGEGDHGFVPILIDLARAKGVAAYIDDGSNRWPGVHRFDAARAYRLALETGVTERRYHAAAEEGIAFRAIAAAIGARLGVPVISVPRADAEAHFGWFAAFAGADMAASSERTREVLGWAPTGPGLLEDLAGPYYYL